MKILVTGGSSAIGKNLIRKLVALDYSVINMSDTSKFQWRLGDNLPKFDDLDYLVHLAHDRSNDVQSNLLAAKKICESYSGKKIFLSSLSAHSKSRSTYGRSKYGQEEIFLDNNGVVLRAGIVFGSQMSGIYQKLSIFLSKFHYFPVPYRGNPTFYMTNVDDLITEILSQASCFPGRPVFCANSSPLTLRKILEYMSQIEETHNTFLELPIQPFDYFVKNFASLFSKSQTLDSLLSISPEVSNFEISQLLKPINHFRTFQSFVNSIATTSAI
jgi:nucleoside-diphosphate-sugar epimerase